MRDPGNEVVMAVDRLLFIDKIINHPVLFAWVLRKEDPRRPKTRSSFS